MLAGPPFSLLDTLDRIDDAIDANADLADAILQCGLQSFGISAANEDWHGTATSADVGKAHSTIRQFYREWSAEGRREREVCYDPVLAVINEFFGSQSRADVRVLIPGAGLGRFVFDVCAAGYAAEGNEISYHQLLASSWVLNHSLGVRQHAVYPFVMQFSNLVSRKQQLQKITVPDIHPASAMAQNPPALGDNDAATPFGSMSMSAADFIPLYSQPAQRHVFDVVATVFFIDTSPNLIRYIETISNCLKPGGLWINMGPLLWHFENDDRNQNCIRDGPAQADLGLQQQEQHAVMAVSSATDNGIGEPGSVELSEDEVFGLVQRMGFTVERRQAVSERPFCGYIQDPESMLQNLYRPSFWVARRNSLP